MLTLNLRQLFLAISIIFPTLSNAQDPMIEFSLSDPSRWDYFSDQVMGGVSSGSASFQQDGGQSILRLTGDVSTANNGGFIQARTKLRQDLPATVRGVVLNVKGNKETYYIHLRTTWTVLPWQFYQASFHATEDWQEVRIPFKNFAPYGKLLRGSFNASSIKSIAVVAFGRDYTADLSVRVVGTY